MPGWRSTCSRLRSGATSAEPRVQTERGSSRATGPIAVPAAQAVALSSGLRQIGRDREEDPRGLERRGRSRISKPSSCDGAVDAGVSQREPDQSGRGQASGAGG